MTSGFREQFFALADQAAHIAVTSHYSPDDDSIGSVLTMRAILADRYPDKRVRIIYTGVPVERYAVFPQYGAIEWVDDVANHLDGVDLLVGLDASTYDRYSKASEPLRQVPVRVAIDHHASQPDEFTLLLKDESFSSNCELLYQTFLADRPFSPDVAQYLLLGIIGDTGNFAYVQPGRTATFSLGGMLVERVGMSIDRFRSRYMGIPQRVIPLLQALVANMAYEAVSGWPPAQYTHISREVMEAGAYTDEDMSAASHIYISQYLPRVEGYAWGFVVTPRADGGCRMSTRSLQGSVNVRDLCERMGVGGGHDRASGAFFNTADPAACIGQVLAFMRANEPRLG